MGEDGGGGSDDGEVVLRRNAPQAVLIKVRI